MLGDGGIFYAGKKSGLPRFEFTIGQLRSEFAQHMAELFKDYAKSGLKVLKVKAKVDGPLLSSYRFKTQSLPVFRYYRDLFYQVNEATGRSVKVVPLNIVELLTPTSLAYLIMSDGNYDANRKRVRIYTNSFTKDDVERLANAINLNFGIYAAVLADRVSKHSQLNQYILTIGANELMKLQTLVLQHMHPTMKYRIGVV